MERFLSCTCFFIKTTIKKGDEIAMSELLQIIEQRELMGKNFKIYGDFENPLFLAKDVANWIGHSNPSKMISDADLAENEVIKHFIGTLTNSYSALFLTEDGLYEVLMQSRKPIAKAFKTEVKAILKGIRKHGMHVTAPKMEAILNDPDSWIAVMTAYRDEKAAKAALLLENAELAQTIEEQAPKVAFADAITEGIGMILIRDLAKILKGNGMKIGERRLFERLRADGFLISRSGSSYNTPTQKAMELGLFKVKEYLVTHTDGRNSCSFTSYVTGKGQEYFVKYFLNGKIASVSV